jgi:hydroxymethylpyrimidine pyrophosphatase-like HAD family hydrolase
MDPDFADITAQGTDKGRGLRAFMAFLGLKKEETMAFGDGGNDIPIVREAGIGVAMGNANESLKAVADYVTAGVDEEGIRKALEHFVFQA